MRPRSLPLLLLCFFLGSPSFGAPEESSHSPRFLAHLLDYLAADYAGAVKDGKVLSPSEYAEQMEFSKSALGLGDLPELKGDPSIKEGLERLDGMIRSKADPGKVTALARGIQAKVVSQAHFPVAPAKWPDLENGKRLFEFNCAKCHGMGGQGDGPSAKGLDPPPANYLSPKLAGLFPLQAFNTVRLGVPNTPMAAFPTFSDQETWDLAFYVNTFRHQGRLGTRDPDPVFQSARSDLGRNDPKLLETLATHSDEEIIKGLKGSPDLVRDKLAALRLRSNTAHATAVLQFARFALQESLASYQKGKNEEASQWALRSYLEGIEPVEGRLRATDTAFVESLEEAMGRLRADLHDGKDLEQVKASAQKALTAVQKANELLGGAAPSPWVTFTLAFGIILREGFEALLLIVALLGVIRASGVKKAAAYVHAGWLSAIALGGLAWFLSGWLMGLSGLGRELMEGLTGALTVVILLYLGFWLHSRTELTRWTKFIHGQVKTALSQSNFLELAFLAFLAAFREVVETVLFLRAVGLEGGSSANLYLGLGVAISFTAILISGWLLITFSARVPVRSLFSVSAMIMGALAFILTGKAIHSLQEADWVRVTPSAFGLHWDWVGVYPTWEAQIAQVLVLALSVFLYYYGKRPSSKR